MPLPPEVDKRIRDRFATLSEELKRLSRIAEDPSSLIFAMEYELSFYAFQTSCLSLMQLLFGKQSQLAKLMEDVRRMSTYQLQALAGIFYGLKDDYECGMFDTIANMVEANVVGDYLSQSERLLTEGKSDASFGHVPAAVLAGAVFEDALRRLAQRQTPPISLAKPGGKPKMMNALIDELKDAGLYNELKAKQLRAWADIRNRAAHGQFSEFTRSDVEQMLTGIQNFLADYM